MWYGFQDGKNLIWSNPNLHGKTYSETLPLQDWSDWQNYGGDKVWTYDQSDFLALLGREGPPDETFDGMPFTYDVLDDGCRITSGISKYSGARLVREFRLEPTGTRVHVHQVLDLSACHEKDDFGTLKDPRFTLWNVTQFQRTDVVLFKRNPESRFLDGIKYWDDVSKKNWKWVGDVGQFTTDPQSMQKVGTDSEAWIAAILDDTVAGQFFRTEPGRTYPDGGCTAECCTFPDYTEVEVLGPLVGLEDGTFSSFDTTWELYRLPEGLSPGEERIRAAWSWLEGTMR